MDAAVELLGRIYDTEVPPDAWLDGVVQAAAPLLDSGEGIEGYHVVLGAHGARADAFAAHPYDAASARARFELWRQHTPASYQDLVHRIVPCGFASDLPTALVGLPSEDVLAPIGRGEVFGVNGVDASGRGCVLVAFTAHRRSTTQPSIPLWTRLAVHLATGARLVRRRAAQQQLAVEAVLEPDGRVVHAEGAARVASARAALRQMAIDVDRAKATAARDPEQAIRLWRALAAGRWSLVDRFERDGRHYLIANPNEVDVPVTAPLTRREEQVVGAAALGHSDKLIAYSLGLTPGTVATHLSRARRKFGVRSRAELVSRWLARRTAETP